MDERYKKTALEGNLLSCTCNCYVVLEKTKITK